MLKCFYMKIYPRLAQITITIFKIDVMIDILSFICRIQSQTTPITVLSAYELEYEVKC